MEELYVVLIIEGCFEGMKLVFKGADGAKDFVSVLLEDMPPKDGVACGDARGVGQAIPRQGTPAFILMQ